MFCYWNHFVKMESIEHAKVFVTIILVFHITISNQFPIEFVRSFLIRFAKLHILPLKRVRQNYLLCFLEFNSLLSLLSFFQIKMTKCNQPFWNLTPHFNFFYYYYYYYLVLRMNSSIPTQAVTMVQETVSGPSIIQAYVHLVYQQMASVFL